MAAGTAGDKAGVSSPVEKQDNLLFPSKPFSDFLCQQTAENRTVSCL